MEETFEIPVLFKGKELSFTAELLTLGYTYRIAVDVNGEEILFERDEERNFRAFIDPERQGINNKIDVELLKAIAEVIEAFGS